MRKTTNSSVQVRSLGVALLVSTAFCLASLTAQVIPTGPQAPVEEYPGFFFDRGSDIAVVDLDGNFVAVWASPNMEQILGQRFDSTGAPVGSEFEISTSGYPGTKEMPSVAGDFAGNFVVVWEHRRDDNQYPGSPEEIVGRRYDSSGPLDTTEFKVNSASPHRHENPSVTRDGNSNFVVVWQREYPESNSDVNDSPPGIFAQRFDAQGTKSGPELVVSTFHGEDGENTYPEVGSALGGDFVVVWQQSGSINEIDDSGDAAVGRRFDSFGAPQEDTEFVVNSYTTGSQSRPSVGVGLDGNFVVAWHGEGESDDWGIFAKQFASTGGAIADEFLVNTLTTGFQTEPRVEAADALGHFAVTWQSRPGSGGDYSLFARWFRSDGLPFEDQFEVPTHTTGTQEAPRIAGDVDGDFVVLWNGDGPVDEGFFVRRFEQPVLLTINDFSIEEGDANESAEGIALLTVEASRAHPSLDVLVEYVTDDESASSFDDYVAASGEVMFAAGTSDLTAVVDVEVVGDDVYEPDETFLFRLGQVQNAAIVREQGIVTILNDDDPPGMTIADASKDEGNDGTSVLAFRVDLTEVQQEDATVDFASSDGTATAGSDYQVANGTLTIPGGSTTGFIGVEINGDFASEGDETLFVTLSSPSNGTLLDDMATGTLLDDDCAVAITIDPASANFTIAGGTGSITVTDSEGCGWMAESSAPWIVITSATNGVGNGTVDYSIAANSDPFPRNGVITIAGQSFVLTQDGVSCALGLDPMSADFSSGGGTGEIAVSDPGVCGWTAVSNEPWILVTGGDSGVDAGTVEYTVEAKTTPGDRSGTILISGLLFTVDQEGSFFDHFDDDVLASNWAYADPQFWSEGNSFLEADVLGGGEEAQAIAAPAFAGCVECTITARIGVDVFALGTVSLYGWYVDDDNFVGLTMNEFANEWKLFQRVGGVEVQSAMTDTEAILTGVLYDIDMAFDGNKIIASVEGDPILNMTPWQASPPSGTVGFHAADTIAIFDLITVLTMTGTAEPSLVFGNGFEGGDLSGWSSHTP